MKRLVLLFVLLLPLSVCRGETWTTDFPGMAGMDAQTDPMDLKDNQAAWLQNLIPSRVYGGLVPRRSLRLLETQSEVERIIGITGYYNSTTGDKLLFGVAIDTADATPIDTIAARFIRSEPFDRTITDTVGIFDPTFDSAFAIPSFSEYYDFEKIRDQLIICDGSNPPWSFQMDRALVDTTATTTQEFFSPDTLVEDPYVTTLGLEAPGQLRAVVLGASLDRTKSSGNTGGNLSGAYSYKIAYTEDSDLDSEYGDADDSTSKSGVPSRVVFPDSQRVLLSLFEGIPAKWEEDSTTRALILRQRNGGQWYIIDTVEYDAKAHFTYVDNIADNATIETFVDDTLSMFLGSNPNQVYDYPPAPGTFVREDTLHGGQRDKLSPSDATPAICDTSKTYWIAYSYYDPVTGIESRMGPQYKIENTDSMFSANAKAKRFAKCYSKPYERPEWIRCYRSLADDSLIMVALYELRANLMHTDSIAYHRSWMPIWGTDADWVSGTITTEKTNYNYGVVGGWWTRREEASPSDDPKGFRCDPFGTEYYVLGPLTGVVHRAITGLGNPIIRPPYIQGSEIVLSDIAYANGRAWGIGDPAFPQRLYFSDYNSINNWSPYNYISVDEDDADELVAVEKVSTPGGKDMICVFKHYKIFMVTGYDPEHDLTIVPLEIGTGVHNKQSIVVDGSNIYFLSSDFRIFRIRGGGRPEELSMPINKELRSMFDYWYAINPSRHDRSARGIKMVNKACWEDEASEQMFCYDLKWGIWTCDVYETIPMYSLYYDTVSPGSGITGTGFNYDFPRIVDTGNSLLTEIDDFAGNEGDGFYIPARMYRTPCLGDGEGLWRVNEVIIYGNFNSGDSIYLRLSNPHVAVTGEVRCQISDLPSSQTTHGIYAFRLGFNAAPCVSVEIDFPDTYFAGYLSHWDWPLYKVTVKYEQVEVGVESY